MVEAQIRELLTAVQSVQAQLTVSEAARTTLQAKVDRMGRASGERKIGVDTEPREAFHRQHMAQLRCTGASGIESMQRVERFPTAENNAVLINDEQVQRVPTSIICFYLGSSSGSRGECWIGRRISCLAVEMHDPHIRSRTAGQLLSLLQFDFSGDVLAKLEAYERDLSLYEQGSGEKISDDLRVGLF